MVPWTCSGRGAAVVFTSKREGMSAVDPTTGEVRWRFRSCSTRGRSVAGRGGARLRVVRRGAWRARDRGRPSGRRREGRVDRVHAQGGDAVRPDAAREGATYSSTWRTTGRSRVPATTGRPSARASQRELLQLAGVRRRQALLCDEEGGRCRLRGWREVPLLGRTSLAEKCHATPAIANGDLYVRTYTHLVCVAGSREDKDKASRR